ncbi:hypothetical protein STEG23_014487, partial [Scotinomys teguina]
SGGPQLLNPPQASGQSENKNGDPKARGTRDVDTTPEVARYSDIGVRSRDTDEEDEQLFRSVEGQAASEEEEEEERLQEKSRPPQAHVDVSLMQPSGCESRCDEQTAETLKTSFGHCDGADHICTLDLETHVTRHGEQLQTLSCSGKTLETPEKEVSRALRSQILHLEGLAVL